MTDQPFDVLGPLPTGTTVLEASAGTGKTWTIAALVTRYVAEGLHTLDELLVVTFGRAASQELRERVREHLVAAAEALGDETASPDDPLLAALCAVPPHERAARARRLRAALAAFDEATIATIHQFCHQVLSGLGVAGDSDPGAALVEDIDDLLMEIVDDLYVRGFAQQPTPPEFDHAEARRIARTVAGDPDAVLVPADAAPGSPEARRVGFAKAVRAELDSRKRKLGILTYDDLLSQVADALRDADAPARQRMRRTWRVVLIDEFQDTDPTQWRVFDRAFTGHATMVLIGDPKQAIYAFRGGDVATYLQAASTAGERRTLATNWRSDAPLVQALGRLLEGAALGDEQIRVQPVAAHYPRGRLHGAPVPHPLRLRFAGIDVAPHRLNRDEDAVLAGPWRSVVAADAARDIAELLTSGATYDEGGAPRPVTPSDIAVLAAKNSELLLMQQQLRAVGVPAVLGAGGSVYATQAAADWRTLLEAIDQPHRSALVRAAALTPFFGRTAADLDEQGDQLTDSTASRLRYFADVYRHRGVAAVFELCNLDGLPGRVLRFVGGERELTDLRHISEALHAASLRLPPGLPALLGWLAEQAEADRPASGDARARRLASDAEAVQLSTIHGSKGLEYPIVYLPFIADRYVGKAARNPLFHLPASPDTSRGPRRAIYIGEPDREVAAAARREDAGESLRLLYVALTRARSQVVAWWGQTNNVEASALHRLLVDRDPAARTDDGAIADTRRRLDAAASIALLDRWGAAGGPQWEQVEKVAAPSVEIPSAVEELSVRSFDRTIDADWRRTSYSALSRALENLSTAGGVDSEPELTGTTDEADIVVALQRDHGIPEVEQLSPMATLPVGATFGSLVHAVLETVDAAAADLKREIAERVRAELVQWPVELDPEVLVDALVAVYNTPLGPLAPGATLRRIGREKLAELEFEVPLGGPDLHRQVRLGQLGDILRRHLPAGDPLLPYAELLRHEELGGQVLRGYLTGSIDVVLRVDGRYLVADYKTNWLGPTDQQLSLGAYGPVPLAAAMGHSDYPLQALLYAATLHRYLRWRLPDYDPDRHLGGVLYLYLRGMAGPKTPVVDGSPTGVFSWRPPTALVLELSDLLDGGAA
ncbi:UvrD-helicase domain-containing protein [Flexivirga caeni]|uniref:RecBCD enzyme subunit RecB n=1 Tax=Flexivirga caeni TaxID=2294115 RepID=A0A3M9M2T1_9MICO|nr:UvrD-helicase domain-containing protein [Flexivirga caeni]RNI19860.1 exodeoxyribonuclease V subunit beta [Flexivirga caeni]